MFTEKDYDIVEREILYQGVFRMVRYQLRYKLFKGDAWSKTVSREVMERKSAAAVLPYDPKTDRVVLIEQFRPGALANPENPWLIEIVAGVFDRDEPPTAVAVREAKEEANCEILDLYPICEYFVSPGGSNEYLHIYCGKMNGHFDGIHGLHEEDEDIRAFSVSFEDAIKMVQEGKIKTSPAILSLYWLQINREQLRKRWIT